jgi:hypothetical protein
MLQNIRTAGFLYSNEPILRSVVLNYLFRYETLLDKNNRLIELNPDLVSKIIRCTDASEKNVVIILEEFLEELKEFWKQLSLFRRTQIYNPPPAFYDRVCKYLIQAYNIAPIFDLERASHNLKILHSLFYGLCFWPKLSIQIALTIFVTDKNDPNRKSIRFILQKNIRAFLYCSAYAFHRTRNRLGINKDGQIR